MNIFKRSFYKINYLIGLKTYPGKAKKLGLCFFPPNYIFLDNFTSSSIIIDVGCGYDAEFSRFMITRHGLNAFGFDPTHKHAHSLKVIEQQTGGKFHHLAYAVSNQKGLIKFYESCDHESGSILSSHSNMLNFEKKAYEVESLLLKDLSNIIGENQIDFIKLDLEGAEYNLLRDVNIHDVKTFNQIFIEFHHHCTEYTKKDTVQIVNNICALGYKSFSFDKRQYLFVKKSASL